MTQAGSEGNFSGIAMQMLGEGSTFFVGMLNRGCWWPCPHYVAKASLPQERKKPTFRKAETSRV